MSESSFTVQIQAYPAISRFFHWLMVVLILSLLGIGWGVDVVHGEMKPLIVTLHKSLGILAFALFFVRLVVRIIFPPPPLIEGMAFSVKLMAETAHVALYTLMLIMPLSGWMLVSAMGRGPSFFGLIDIPALFSKTPVLVPLLREIHENGSVLLAGLVLVHAGAAFYHHFIRRDETLLRMLPQRFR